MFYDTVDFLDYMLSSEPIKEKIDGDVLQRDTLHSKYLKDKYINKGYFIRSENIYHFFKKCERYTRKGVPLEDVPGLPITGAVEDIAWKVSGMGSLVDDGSAVDDHVVNAVRVELGLEISGIVFDI